MGKHTGKKRWRKTDISDIQAALTSDKILREHLGTAPQTLNILPSKSLFQIDKVGKVQESKSRTKQFYKDKKLRYEIELEPSHIVPPKIAQSNDDDTAKAKKKLTKVLLNMEKKQLVAERPSKKKKPIVPVVPKVYDIWSAPLEPRKEIIARPYPQKPYIRKPSELSAMELPQSDVSYNPSEESVEKVKKSLKRLSVKRKADSDRLNELIKPTRVRTVAEIQETMRPLTAKQLLQVKKNITKSRTKASKPAKKILNTNYSSKLNRTHRNALLKKKLRRQLLQKNRREERRSKELDKVEQIASELQENSVKSKKRVSERKEKEKQLQAIKMKRLRHKLVVHANTSFSPVIPSSLRSFMPSGNEMKEKVLRYQQRNMVVG